MVDNCYVQLCREDKIVEAGDEGVMVISGLTTYASFSSPVLSNSTKL